MEVLGCNPMHQDHGTEAFLNLPLLERRAAIHDFDPDKQIDLYLRAMLASHPPDLGLTAEVAKGGLTLLPALDARVSREIDDEAALLLVQLLAAISVLNPDSVTQESSVVVRAARRVSSLRDAGLRGKAMECLALIPDRGRTMESRADSVSSN